CRRRHERELLRLTKNMLEEIMSVLSAVSPIYHPPLEPYVSILHREEGFLVLDKPSGLLSVPGSHPALADSLATRVQKQFPQAQMINRLDKDTSGLVLMS